VNLLSDIYINHIEYLQVFASIPVCIFQEYFLKETTVSCNQNLRDAVRKWLSSPEYAEKKYGHMFHLNYHNKIV
jgi:hypothetical protein